MTIIVWIALSVLAANAAFFGILVIMYLMERRRERYGRK